MANLQGNLNKNENLHGSINSKNAALQATLNIGGKSVGQTYYLGDVSTFTQDNPFDLNALNEGQYVLSNEYGRNIFYIRVKYKGQTFTERCLLILNGYIYADTFILNMYRKVGDDLPSGTHICNFSFIDMAEETGILTFKDAAVFIYDNYVNVGMGYMFEFRNVTTNLSQTITGLKTFDTLPVSTIEPTQDVQFVNKKYVDNHALDLLGLQEYSRTATYNIGDCVYHDSLIYKCTVAINPPENWNASHWTEITYISYLKEILNE